MGEMCERLLACGVPLWRAAVFVRTLHPQVTGRRFLWRLGAGVEVGELAFERLDTEEYRDSPVVRIYATKSPLRRRLRHESDAAEFEVLRSLYAGGATDYLASPLLFIDGSVHVATWATRQRGGFTDAQRAALEAVAAPLARVTEIYALRRTATNLLAFNRKFLPHWQKRYVVLESLADLPRVGLAGLAAEGYLPLVRQWR